MLLRFLFFMLLVSELCAQSKIQGFVLDSLQKRPLAFVSISVEGYPNASTMSDIDGQFTLDLPNGFPATIQCSSLGFKKEVRQFNEAPNSKLRIEMRPSSLLLREFEVRAGENPAHRIIRQTWQNRKIHDPENYDSYSCNTYNKLVLTGRKDTTFAAKNEEDIRKAFSVDSFLQQQHIFLIESSNERLFRKGKVKENVLASRVSGMKEASIFMLALQFQPFGFYAPLVELNGKKLLNPISKNSEDVYSFVLEDTLFQGRDSIYVIRFKPRKNSTFEGLKGVMYVSAPDYAIQNIIASPNEESSSMQMTVQQQYKRDENGFWFPEQLNTDIVFLNIQLTGQKTFGESRTYIQNVKINPELSSKLFDEVELDVLKGASKKDSLFWKNVRIEELGEREKRTYFFLDSLSKAENIERKLKSFEALTRGYIPIRWFDLDINRILRFNNYEGFRLGAGGITNDQLSKHFGIGGYFAYGFKDRASKFGLESRFYLNPKNELELRTLYSNDVWESGASIFENDSKQQRVEQIRQVLVSRMDSEERTEAQLSWRSFKYLKTNVFVRQSHVLPQYTYGYSDLPVNSRFSWLETGFSLTYCYKERFYRNGKLKLPLGSNSPTFRFQYTHGKDLNWGGKTQYNKALFRIDYGYKWRRIGKTTCQLVSGIVNGAVPYARLFNGKGNLTENADLRAVSMNSFETMMMNEFASDAFVSGFFQHDFGSFFKIKNFSPRFVIVQNMLFGKISASNILNQREITFKQANKGYFESGMQINNLYVLNSAGYGIGGYYHWGNYVSSDWKKNIALKLSLSLSF
jgi:hypothetical protein